jgi:hypothetical protein
MLREVADRRIVRQETCEATATSALERGPQLRGRVPIAVNDSGSAGKQRCSRLAVSCGTYQPMLVYLW